MTLAHVEPGLTGFSGAHGGHLAALALEAMAEAVDDPGRPPRSLTINLMAPARGGAIELDARVERAGRSMSFASLRAVQQGAPVAMALATFGAPRSSLVQRGVEMPAVPPPEACEPLLAAPVPEAGAAAAVEHRPAAEPLPLSGGDRAEIVVWMRLTDDAPIDPYVASFLADSAVPALYGSLLEHVPIPSAEISLAYAPFDAWMRSPWALGVFRNTLAMDGYAVEDGQLWTPEGELLVQARQVRRILPRPRPAA